MGQLPPKGISRKGVDAAFEAEEAKKSHLILEAHALRARGDPEQAAAKFAQAAEIEEELASRCDELGLTDKSHVHRFSAVSCWAQAGNFYAAISLGDDLLERPTLPARLREHVSKYVQTLRTRRSQWYSELVQLVGEES